MNPDSTENTQKDSKTNDPQKDLTHYVNKINQFLNTSSVHNDGENGDTRLQFAIQCLYEGLELYPDAYELKFLAHRISIKEGDMSQAIKYFDELRRLFPSHEPLKEYLVQITHSVRHRFTDDNFNYHEMAGAYLDACRLYVLLLKAYPETVALYGSHAAQLAIQCENQNQPLPVSNSYRKILVEDILSEILHQKIIVYDNNLPSEIPIYQPKTSKSSISLATSSTSQSNTSQSCLHVTYNQLKSLLEKAQGFYIANKDWRKLFEVSLGVMNSCGYLRFESSPRTTMVDLFDDPHQLPLKLFSLLNQKQLSLVNQTFMMHDTAPHPFAVSIGIACFVLCCHEFYEYVAGLKSKRTCLIPIFPIGQFAILTPLSSPRLTSTSLNSYAHHVSCNETRINKRRRLSLSFLLSRGSNDKEVGETESESYIDDSGVSFRKSKQININSVNDEISNKYRDSSVMNVKNLLIGNDDEQLEQNSIETNHELKIEQIKLWEESNISSETIIHNAMSHMERALTCWQFLKEMVSRGGNDPKVLDQELENHIQSWDLPLDVSNAIMLTRGDLAFSHGSLDTACTFCREICTRISSAWDAYRKKAFKKEQSPSLSSTTDYLQTKQLMQEESSDSSKINDFSIKVQTPLILPFRVIYSISMLYLLVGWWREARVELLIILATIPFTPVTREHFERDDWYINKKKIDGISYGEEYKRKQFRLMEVTQEGLVVRAIKELMACYEKELSSIPHNQLDNTLGHIIVLTQYGWPYWRDRLFRRVILPGIKEHGGLTYPDMLRFVYNIEILREICELHRKSPDLNFSLLKQSSTATTSADHLSNLNITKTSIKALEDKINHPSSRSINEKLVEFCKEKLIQLQSNVDGNLYSDGFKAKGKEIPPRNDSRYKEEKSCDNSDLIDMQSSQMNITDNQETQKSWKMDVSSIVAEDHINKISSRNYDHSNGINDATNKRNKEL
ncbi:3969_t:CDS:10 [Funneliformis geosporum]|uniref:Integrator complex subunit 10 n=1 Tax=Funneliformis geosporum TaxID=1117311 RepID=A0A9W4SWL9_9GLOM|nr:5210_t:CDS:10 [Funneliformis geosporum]CAI2186353.1 3969_t:CDS:10 [Funneliformis geosporum]